MPRNRNTAIPNSRRGRYAALALAGTLCAGCLPGNGTSAQESTAQAPVESCKGIITSVSQLDPPSAHNYRVEDIGRDNCAALLSRVKGEAIGSIAIGDTLTTLCDPELTGATAIVGIQVLHKPQGGTDQTGNTYVLRTVFEQLTRPPVDPCSDPSQAN